MDNIDIFNPAVILKTGVANMQARADATNADRIKWYEQAKVDWIANASHDRDIGIPIPAVPVKPKKIVITDAGEWTEVDNLDLVDPQLPPPTPAQTGNPLGALSPNTNSDRVDQIILQNISLHQDIGNILAAVQALTSAIASLQKDVASLRR